MKALLEGETVAGSPTGSSNPLSTAPERAGEDFYCCAAFSEAVQVVA